MAFNDAHLKRHPFETSLQNTLLCHSTTTAEYSVVLTEMSQKAGII